MTDLDHRAGLCSPVMLSGEKAFSPIRACSHPHPPGSGRLEAAHGRHAAHCRSRRCKPTWPASHYLDYATGSFVHADLKRE